MKPFIISKRTPPPPHPHRGTFDRQLRILALLLAAASGALLLTACDSPTGENTNTNAGKVTPKTYTTTITGRVTDESTGAGVPGAEVSASTAPGNVVKTRSDGSFTLQVKEHTGTFTLTVKKAGYIGVTISISAKKTNHTVPVIQLAEPYTTTVRGKVVTPARAADPAKGSFITTARVWSSVDPTKKAAVGADGSYSLQVAGHTGNFTITAEYTATGNRNYKTSDPKNVTTKGASIDNQDIPLNYGYTTEFTAQVSLNMNTTSGGRIRSGVTIIVTAEDGYEVGRGITSGAAKRAVITVDHPGRITVAASRDGYRGDSRGARNSERISTITTERTFDTGTLYLYQNVP